MTERLIGRPPLSGEAVFADLCLIYKDVHAMRALSEDGKPHGDRTILAIGDRWAELWREKEVSTRLFYDRSENRFVGYCGLRDHRLEDDDLRDIELFYGVRSDSWQKGYGREMARSVVQEGFDRFGFQSIIAFASKDNVASQGVMRSVGMSYEKDLDHASQPHVLYRITRDNQRG